MRCGLCGSVNCCPRNAQGKVFPYKQHEAVVLNDVVILMMCLDCDNVMMRPGDAKRLDEGLENSVNQLSAREVAKATSKEE